MLKYSAPQIRRIKKIPDLPFTQSETLEYALFQLVIDVLQCNTPYEV